jgi:8-oxo-dGTP diphosphatase
MKMLATIARDDEPAVPEGGQDLALVQSARYQSTEKNPRVGCAGIVRRGNEVLLGRRNKEPNRGLWVLPGGGVVFGETLAETLCRELYEEAGIEIVVDGVFNVYELITPPEEHRLIVYLTADYRDGNPVASDDLSEVGFFTAAEIRRLSLNHEISPLVEKVLREAAIL